MSGQYGYWTWNGKNGLEGSESILVEQPDGTVTVQKDPTFPAVLADQFIVHALNNSRIARTQFNALYPSLDPRSKVRLQNLMVAYPRLAKLLENPFFNLSAQQESDNIQNNDVTSGVHLEKPVRRAK